MQLAFLLTLKRLSALDHDIQINKLEYFGVRGVTKNGFVHICKAETICINW